MRVKAHDWFILPLSKQAHDEYHSDAAAWADRYIIVGMIAWSWH
jgi:hypothetical protein